MGGGMIATLRDKIGEMRDAAATARKVLGLLWEYDRFSFVGYLVAIAIPSATLFINAYIYKLIIDLAVAAYNGAAFNFHYLWLLIGFRFGTMVLQDLAYSAQAYFDKKIWIAFPSHLEHLILSKISSLDLQYFENPEFQTKLERVRDAYMWRPFNMISYSFMIFQGFVQFAIALSIILSLNWILMIIVLASAVPAFFIQTSYASTVWSISSFNSPFQKKHGYLSRRLQLPEDQREIRLFETAPKFLAELRSIFDMFIKEYGGAARRRLKLDGVLKLLSAALYIGTEIFIVLSAIWKKITIGSISYYTSVLYNFESAVGGLFMNSSQLFEASLYVKDIFEVLELEPVITTKADAVAVDGAHAPRIEFRNVSFAYPGTTKKVFENFSLVIEPGEKVAIVGENGAGKTTLVKLLARFYDVTEGEILVDGVNLKDLDLVSWRRALGVLFQDYVHYQYPLRDNIAFGRLFDEATDEEIAAAAKLSGADAVAAALPDGYGQMLGKFFEGGVELSTGQWQKVALARAFLRNAPVLILDEPTASIDAKAEAEIFARVEELSSEKSVVIISHRFSTVRNADKIYVIEHGKIIEAGSHGELMKLDRIYASLFTLQAKAYQ